MGQNTALLIITLILITYLLWRLCQEWLLRTLPTLEWANQAILLDAVRWLGIPALFTARRGGTAVWAGGLFPKVVLTDGEGRMLSTTLPLHYHGVFAGGPGDGRGLEVGPRAQEAYRMALRKRGDVSVGQRITLHAVSWEELLEKAAAVVELLESGVPDVQDKMDRRGNTDDTRAVAEYLRG